VMVVRSADSSRARTSWCNCLLDISLVVLSSLPSSVCLSVVGVVVVVVIPSIFGSSFHMSLMLELACGRITALTAVPTGLLGFILFQ
jgi:hypothetical protein